MRFNAKLKSKRETAIRLINGEEFIFQDQKVYFNETDASSPFILEQENGPACMFGAWNHFASFEVEREPEWQDFLKNGPILCWAWDKINTQKRSPAIIERIDENGNYQSSDGNTYDFAEPLNPDSPLIFKG
jgi:hypothetical protein